MQIVCDHKELQAWVENIPSTFELSGSTIYNARNQIRIIPGPDGKDYVVKRYRQPMLFNRIIYRFFRKPKAVRAYMNAFLLEQKGIATPRPIGYILIGQCLLKESYLITERCPYPHRLYAWGDGKTAGREDLMRAFGRFTGEMHEVGALHLDYSPGNILYDKDRFSVVDVNRMHWGPISIEQGCRNLARLWGEEEMYRLIAEGYAAARKAPQEQCFTLMWQAHQHYWSHKNKPLDYGTYQEN